MALDSEEVVSVSAYMCSCAAGKGLCNHLTALLYQTAHYVQLNLQTVPTPLACTSEPQRWHRPRTQGVHPEAVSELRILKPKSVGKTGIKSTLYKAYTGPLPDPDVLASGAKLSQINPKPLLAHILEGMSKVELVPSQFSPVPRGSPLSYQCPPIAAGVPDVNFPPLPVLGYQFGCNFKFKIEEATRLQSKCTAWGQIRQSRVTASRFREVCHVVGDSASQSLAARIIKGTRQTSAMKCGLELEPDILRKYSETASVKCPTMWLYYQPRSTTAGS